MRTDERGLPLTTGSDAIDDHVLAFTDLHVMVALVMAGRYQAAEQCLASLRAFADTPNNFAAATMTRITVPLCESILAYGKGAPRRLSMACYLYAMIMPVSVAATRNAMFLPSS
jgi:hypothetical protein